MARSAVIRLCTTPEPLPPTRLEPFQKLCIALIRSAVVDAAEGHHMHLVGGKARHARTCPRCSAVRWLDGADAPLTFQTACDALGVCADELRDRVARVRRRR